LATASIILFSNPVTATEKSEAKQNNTYRNFSLAKPNWWLKPTLHSNKSTKSTVDYSQVKSEPISNFLTIPVNDDWQIISGGVGVSSVKYQLIFEEKKYELAIMRMNKNVQLASILTIWQNKAGLAMSSETPSSNFETKNKQRFELYSYQGINKSILVATHKLNKYTFFRLLGEQNISKEVTDKFKEFLDGIVITS